MTEQNQLPPQCFSAIPIVHELTCVYITLHNAIREFPKLERYSIGVSIEQILLDCIKQTFLATVIPPGSQKLHFVGMVSAQFDTLKLFIRISVDTNCLCEKTYVKLLPHLGSIGAMLGGWLRDAQKPSGQIQKLNQYH